MIMNFSYRHRVTYSDCTVGNHVYYSRYLDLVEAARGEFFRHLGTTFQQWQEADAIFPVIECRIRYDRPARYDDPLEIAVWCPEARGIRMTLAFGITDLGGRPVASGQTEHVCTTLAGKVRRLPEPLCELLKPFTAGPSARPARPASAA